MSDMNVVPIETIHLFPRLNEQLISFLKSLSPDQWELQTVARKWKVRDVAAHLLDGNLRRIALHRDGWSPPPTDPIHSYTDLVNYLNTLNADWVKACQRLSPSILVELLEESNEKVYRLFSKLDPFGEAVFPVGWAGETVSQNWFDLAREYTERWLHQQQIRDATGNDELLGREFYQPFLNIFFQAWPYTMASVLAAKGTVLKTVITGSGGGDWLLLRENDTWKLTGPTAAVPVAETTIDGKIAWKLFSKSIQKENVTKGILITGNKELGEKVLDMVSVMA